MKIKAAMIAIIAITPTATPIPIDAEVDRPEEVVLAPAVEVWVACDVDVEVALLADEDLDVVEVGCDVAVAELDWLVDVASSPSVDCVQALHVSNCEPGDTSNLDGTRTTRPSASLRLGRRDLG